MLSGQFPSMTQSKVRLRFGHRGLRAVPVCPRIFHFTCGNSNWASLCLCIVLWCCLCCVTASALDPSKQISQYAHAAWRIRDGDFNGTPHVIAQTSDGYLWIGTEAGLLRFDGVRFVPWSPPEGKQLRSNRIYSLLGTPDGSLWIGTHRGLSRWKDRDLFTFDGGGGRVNNIVQDRQGTVWMVRSRVLDTSGALCRVGGSQIQCYSPANGADPWATGLTSDQSGSLWIGSNTIYRWKSGSSTTYLGKNDKLYSGLTQVPALASDPDGSVFIALQGSGKHLGLHQIVNGALKTYSVPGMDGSSLDIQAILVDRDENLWIGTNNDGLYHVHGGVADHFSSADGLSSNSVENLFEDREGDIWVVNSKGIDRFHDLPVTNLSTQEGLTADRVHSVFASHDGALWIGNEGGLDILRNGKISSIQPRDGFPGRQVTSMFEDHAGALWVGVDSRLTVYERGEFREIRRSDGSSLGVVAAITEDNGHDIWVIVNVNGGPYSLFRIHDRKVQQVTNSRDIDPISLTANLDEGVWAGLDDMHLVRYGKGAPDAFVKKGPGRSFQILADTDGSVWGATVHGLAKWKDGTEKTLDKGSGLPCDSVYTLITDSLGSLWLYTECGVIRIEKSELEKWWTQSTTRVRFRQWDVLEGVLPASATFSPKAARSRDGRLWFANDSMVQVIDPAHLNTNTTVPPVHVEEFIADHKSYDPREGLRLPALVRDLEIDYTALSFVEPRKVLFRFELDGHDVGWQEPGNRRQAFYNNLPPGKYRFRVIACNNDGVWNETGATLSFSIASAFYQTWWFILLWATAAVAAIWLLYLFRLRRITSQLQVRLSERLVERERIARELHDTLLQGFQGLILRFHGVLKQMPDHEPSRQLMEGALNRADQVLIEGRNRVRDLRAESALGCELPEEIAACGKDLARDKSISFSLAIVGPRQPLHPVVRDEAYQIGREALINAFQHSKASKIEAEITFDCKQVRLVIRDDGTGMDQSVLNEGRPGHWGLSGMRERAEKIGAQLNIWGRPGAGTEVDLMIPAKLALSRSLRPLPLSWINRAASGGR
jgi:signal transduction histidine kinase/ligand-binding sensor domain-containing protein